MVGGYVTSAPAAFGATLVTRPKMANTIANTFATGGGVVAYACGVWFLSPLNSVKMFEDFDHHESSDGEGMPVGVPEQSHWHALHRRWMW